MTQPWRIDPRYVDDRGVEHEISAPTRGALARLLGEPDAADAGPLVVDQSWVPHVDGVVALEDGTERCVARHRPATLPPGYHRLVQGCRDRTLIVAPRRCRQPSRRTWGIAVQLYAARSHASWGMGDLRDLGALRAAAARAGAGFVLVNPLHATAPSTEQEPCPYAPVTRLFSSPLYLSIPDVPGAAATDLADLALAGAEANSAARIDRDRVWRIKREALARIRAHRVGEAAFDAWRERQPAQLRRFAVWCAISEVHGPSTNTWPAGLRRWDAPAVAAFAAAAAERVAFHEWLQWLVALQTERYGDGIIHDLAIGVRPDGADVWMWPEMFAVGATIGAPPDALNTTGQDWGLVPLHPGRLRTVDYRPFRELLRASLHGSGGLRIDHVLGLFRLWFIPQGAGAAGGAYVRYPADELLAVLALESHRAGVPVIGEDLGTVEEGVRERLGSRGVLTSRVLLLHEDPPSRWPVGSLGCTTTHDLPTLPGLWTGTDLADQQAAGVAAVEETGHLRELLAERTGVQDGDATAVVTAAHRRIGAAPSVLTAVGLEDLLGVEHRPNIPATQRPDNWTRPLPVPIDELDDVLVAAAAVLDRPGPPPPAPPPAGGSPEPDVAVRLVGDATCSR